MRKRSQEVEQIPALFVEIFVLNYYFIKFETYIIENLYVFRSDAPLSDPKSDQFDPVIY